MKEDTQNTPPCPVCHTPCKFLTVRFENVARCPECGNVLRQYFGDQWMSEKQAIEFLYKVISDVKAEISKAILNTAAAVNMPSKILSRRRRGQKR